MPYTPADEEYRARPEITHRLVRHVEEPMAVGLACWDPELSIVAPRFSNAMGAEEYEQSRRPTPSGSIRESDMHPLLVLLAVSGTFLAPLLSGLFVIFGVNRAR